MSSNKKFHVFIALTLKRAFTSTVVFYSNNYAVGEVNTIQT